MEQIGGAERGMLCWHTLEYVTGGHGDGFLFGV
jgi:hypothetical protein